VTTTAADLIQPEVWGPAVMKTVLGKSVLAPFIETSNELEGNPGDEVHFPKFGYIGDAEDIAEDEDITLSDLSMTDSVARIKEIAKGGEITDRAVLTSIGRPLDQLRNQLGISIGRKMDTDIRKAAEEVTAATADYEASSPLLVPAADSKLTWSRVTDGIALLGDEWDPAAFAAFVIHSKQHVDLLNDPNFVGIDKFGSDSVILRGQVGRIATVPVIVSDRATVTDNAGTPNYNALLLKQGAISLLYKRRPLVESDRDILGRKTIVTVTAHYALKRVDDRGVVVIPTK